MHITEDSGRALATPYHPGQIEAVATFFLLWTRAFGHKEHKPCRPDKPQGKPIRTARKRGSEGTTWAAQKRPRCQAVGTHILGGEEARCLVSPCCSVLVCESWLPEAPPALLWTDRPCPDCGKWARWPAGCRLLFAPLQPSHTLTATALLENLCLVQFTTTTPPLWLPGPHTLLYCSHPNSGDFQAQETMWVAFRLLVP